MIFILAVVLIPALIVTQVAGSSGAGPDVQTWFHNTAVKNWTGTIADNQVRQSHLYEISVSSDQSTFFDSFVYETIPRNGHGKITTPGDPSSTTDEDDSITIEVPLNMSMAWSSFLYNADVEIKVKRLDGVPTLASDAIIRPSTLGYAITQGTGDIRIAVPYSSAGARFSVEFKDNAYSYQVNGTGDNVYYIQDEVPNGEGYVPEIPAGAPIVGTEPRDALLIFASPFENPEDVPSKLAANTYVVPQGQLSGLNTTTANTLYFEPGVYYSGSTSHANLSASVNWVYFAPGSYVKSAIEFNNESSLVMATGHGVLSGEQYLYQANTADGYKNEKSDDTSLRMWSGHVPSDRNQTFRLNGPTVNSPPFNSMDFKGDVNSLVMDAQDYKQVGAYYGQTDGLENYPCSHVRNVFYHSNDDTIKTYYSDVMVENITVWKGKTAPTIQFGWSSRNASNITVQNVDIIHSRYQTNGSHPSIIGANQIYQSAETDTRTGNMSNTLSDITFQHIRSEGISPSLLRVVPLANWEGITISDVWVEAFVDNATGMSTSYIPAWTDAAGQQMPIDRMVIKDVTTGEGRRPHSLISNGFGLTNGGIANIDVSPDYVVVGNVTII